MTIALVVPCYQEEEALACFADALREIAADEVVFVDDGSTDGTAALLAAWARSDESVSVRTHEPNRGVGAAVRTGIAATRADVVVVYDADRTYPPEDVKRLVAAVDAGADLATASPFAAGGAAEGVSFIRRALSRGAAWTYRVVLGKRAGGIRTFTCAFRAYRGPLVRALAYRSDGFPAAAEILGRGLLAGWRVVEVPSQLTQRTEGRSKMRVGRALCGHVKTLMRLLGARFRGRRSE